MNSLFPERILDEYVASTSYDFRSSDRGDSATGRVENITNLLVSSDVLEHAIPSRIQRDHPVENVIGLLADGVQTRCQSGHVNECLYSCFISQIESKNVEMSLNEPSWVDAMHEELNQFEKLKVWQLVELPEGKKSLDTRWVFRNKQDDSGVIVRNKALLVVRGFRKIEGLDYTKVMKKRFEMSSLGEMTMFLGLQVRQSSSGILLHQGKYVDDILENFGFRDAKVAATPMAERPLMSSDLDVDPIDQTLYRSMIGSLMYFKGRPKLDLWYPKNYEFDLYAFTDSNYGGCDIDRKSTSAGCQFLGDRIISWQCKKQQTVSTSTSEAEYIAASACCSQGLKSKLPRVVLRYSSNRSAFLRVHIDTASSLLLSQGWVLEQLWREGSL
ncbi:hypothetical protein L2E82_35084 [Cichorium intybus]|uniref:Uncharacterized protein n=1 Tax=Cichorium intybus TaxID=13427 RepID=A0ACB9BN67_CICIN|nr:hypothetical protein L2E82_35084 [Cichorium intybus]